MSVEGRMGTHVVGDRLVKTALRTKFAGKTFVLVRCCSSKYDAKRMADAMKEMSGIPIKGGWIKYKKVFVRVVYNHYGNDYSVYARGEGKVS